VTPALERIVEANTLLSDLDLLRVIAARTVAAGETAHNEPFA